MQRNLVLVNDLFKSIAKGNVANCMTNRSSVHTGNASEQLLHRNRTLILVHTVHTGAIFETEQKPIRYSVNIVALLVCDTIEHDRKHVVQSLRLYRDQTLLNSVVHNTPSIPPIFIGIFI